MYDIFISYRRYDNEGKVSGRDIARTIKLEFRLRGYKVFFDYSDIKDDNFVNTIDAAVRSSKIFLLVITTDTFARCADDDDFLRREIEIALQNNIKIVMTSIDGAFKSWPSNLPISLRELKPIEISSIHTDSTFEKCIDLLEENRIKNVARPSNWGAKIWLKSDKPCVVRHFDEEIAVLQNDTFKPIYLKKGPHILFFENMEDSNIVVEKRYVVEDVSAEDYLQVTFKNGKASLRTVSINSQEVENQQRIASEQEKQMTNFDNNVDNVRTIDSTETNRFKYTSDSNIEDVDYIEITDDEKKEPDQIPIVETNNDELIEKGLIDLLNAKEDPNSNNEEPTPETEKGDETENAPNSDNQEWLSDELLKLIN